jgi:hypothetical protein
MLRNKGNVLPKEVRILAFSKSGPHRPDNRKLSGAASRLWDEVIG